MNERDTDQLLHQKLAIVLDEGTDPVTAEEVILAGTPSRRGISWRSPGPSLRRPWRAIASVAAVVVLSTGLILGVVASRRGAPSERSSGIAQKRGAGTAAPGSILIGLPNGDLALLSQATGTVERTVRLSPPSKLLPSSCRALCRSLTTGAPSTYSKTTSEAVASVNRSSNASHSAVGRRPSWQKGPIRLSARTVPSSLICHRFRSTPGPARWLSSTHAQARRGPGRCPISQAQDPFEPQGASILRQNYLQCRCSLGLRTACTLLSPSWRVQSTPGSASNFSTPEAACVRQPSAGCDKSHRKGRLRVGIRDVSRRHRPVRRDR